MRRIQLWMALLGVVLGATIGPATAQDSPPGDALLSDDEIVAWLSGELDRMAKSANFSGVMLFARGTDILLHRAYGLASRRFDAANTLGTRFNLASASKMFTGVVVGKLAEEGRLAFSDPIRKYLGEEWVSEEVGASVTISHLLSHTSGLGHYWEEWDDHWPKIRTLDDYQMIISDELSFEPGSEWKYSNSGYILLGAIVEKVTGKSYYGYVREAVFAPAGMEGSGFFEIDLPIPNLAVGYWEDEDDGGRLKNNTMFIGYRGSPAGGAWATAADMHRFILALTGSRLVSKQTQDRLWPPKPNSPKYGYGFQGKDGWVGHTGGFDGFESYIYHYPESGHTFILLCNYYDSGYPLALKINKLYPRLRVKTDAQDRPVETGRPLSPVPR